MPRGKTGRSTLTMRSRKKNGGPLALIGPSRCFPPKGLCGYWLLAVLAGPVHETFSKCQVRLSTKLPRNFRSVCPRNFLKIRHFSLEPK